MTETHVSADQYLLLSEHDWARSISLQVQQHHV